MAKELRIFIDNKPGRLKAVTNIMSKNDINIRAISVQSRDDFGLIKMLVDKPEEACLELTNYGFACIVKEILAIKIEDKPGGLEKILTVFADKNINIKDSFAFIIEPKKFGVLCIELDEMEKTKEALLENGIRLLKDQDLYGL